MQSSHGRNCAVDEDAPAALVADDVIGADMVKMAHAASAQVMQAPNVHVQGLVISDGLDFDVRTPNGSSSPFCYSNFFAVTKLPEPALDGEVVDEHFRDIFKACVDILFHSATIFIRQWEEVATADGVTGLIRLILDRLIGLCNSIDWRLVPSGHALDNCGPQSRKTRFELSMLIKRRAEEIAQELRKL
eukprot:TRINITY_DN7806_c0_g1_i1.p1 TRINITY_DN7806_c0_g1~~TRINITY_DN7806_c0_g1_i1.p1  ORF type:complete len:189 (+),score=45.94 TRINITY_DN7806_c0_g1_i1:324-890(+)